MRGMLAAMIPGKKSAPAEDLDRHAAAAVLEGRRLDQRPDDQRRRRLDPAALTREVAPMRVGFIGLGSQGGPMARRIVEQGFATTLWARRAVTLEPFADTAADVAALAARARRGERPGLRLRRRRRRRRAGARRATTACWRGMRRGGVVAVHSTVHPATCRRLAAAWPRRGVTLLDAPVSGGGAAAAERRLLVMVGGDARTRSSACRPVFATYGDPVLHLGPVGSGADRRSCSTTCCSARTSASRPRPSTSRAALDVDPRRSAGCSATRIGPQLRPRARRRSSVAPLAPLARACRAAAAQGRRRSPPRSRAPRRSISAICSPTADAALAGAGHPRRAADES